MLHHACACNVFPASPIQHLVTPRAPETRPADDPHSDEQLMRVLGEGGTAAFGVLFRRHYARVQSLCARLCGGADAADDLAQETFLRALRHRHGFRGDARFTTWLYQVARNVCLQHLADAARDRAARERWQAEASTDSLSATGEGDLDDRAAVVTAAMARLDPSHREVLVLCRLDELSFNDVAAILGCTPGAARVRAHRALRALRDLCAEAPHRP